MHYSIHQKNNKVRARELRDKETQSLVLCQKTQPYPDSNVSRSIIGRNDPEKKKMIPRISGSTRLPNGYTCVIEGVGQAVAAASLDAEPEERALALLQELADPGGGGVRQGEDLAARGGADPLHRGRGQLRGRRSCHSPPLMLAR